MKGEKIKRIMSVLAALAMIPAVTSGVKVDAEVLLDATFEQTADGWSPHAAGQLSRSAEQAHSGEASLKITGRSAPFNGPMIDVTTLMGVGGTYQISAWAFQESGGNAEFKLMIKYTSPAGEAVYDQLATANSNSGEWANMTREYTIPEGVGHAMYFECGNQQTDFYIDDVVIDGQRPEINPTGDTLYDFEEGLSGWGPRGGTETVVLSEQYAHSGTNSIYCSGRTEAWNGPSVAASLFLLPGETYNFSAWVYYDDPAAGDTQGFDISLECVVGVDTLYPSMTGAVTVQKGVWTEVSGKSTVPAGAAGLKLYIQPAYNPNPGIENTVSYYVDDVSVKSVSDSIQEDIDGIKDVYDGYFTVGGAAGSSDLDSKARQALFLKHYNTLTMGNELKPNYTLDQAATVTAGEPQVRLNADARKMLQFAQDNGLPVRGHCLLWHAQTPTWFFRENFDIGGQAVSKEVLRERLEIYIKNTMILVQTEFPDVEFYAWDVVNEVYKDDGNLRDAGWWGEGVDNELSPWAMIYGDDSFVDDAFEFARMYAPEDCKLFYNDFNEYIPAKRDKIAEKMLSLKESGNVDGIGMQAHLDTSFPTPASFKEALDVFLYTGLEVHITELDMTINPELSLNDAVDYDINTQGQLYQELFEGIRDSRMNHPNGENLTAVVFWGTDDATSWRGDRKPLLFDGDFQAKPAYYGVIEGVVPIGSDQYNVGDVNLDGEVTIADVVVLAEFLIDKRGLVPAQLKVADVYSDTMVDIKDVLALVMYLR